MEQPKYKISQILLVVRVWQGVVSTFTAHPHPLPTDHMLQYSFQSFLHPDNYKSQTRSNTLLTFDNWWPNSSSFCCNGVLNSSSSSRFFWIFPAIKETTIMNKTGRLRQKQNHKPYKQETLIMNSFLSMARIIDLFINFTEQDNYLAIFHIITMQITWNLSLKNSAV